MVPEVLQDTCMRRLDVGCGRGGNKILRQFHALLRIVMGSQQFVIPL